MKIIYDYIIRNLNTMHYGAMHSKFLAVFSLSAPPAFGLTLLEKLTSWYVNNQIFMTFVFLALVIDHILGTYIHLKIKKDFTLKKNLDGLLRKGFSVVAGYVLFEMVHQIVKDVDFIATYFKVLLQLMVMLYPVGSAMSNLSLITNGKFPPIGWMKKLEKFNESADIETFKTKNNETEEFNNNPTE